MLVPVYNKQGERVSEALLRDDIFGVPVSEALMHQALLRQLANARLGTHKTKTRGEVAGGGRKPWRQKGTGRARQGSIRSPQWRGGGVVFGPQPRSYRQQMPRKMRRQALRSALSVKAAGSQVVVLDSLEMREPRTKEMIEMLKTLGIESSALILLPGRNETILHSVRNLPRVRTLVAQYLNVRDLLQYDTLIVPLESLAVIEGILGTAEEAPTRGDAEETPTRGDAEETPTRGYATGDGEAPTRGDAEETPTRGDAEETPTRGYATGDER